MDLPDTDNRVVAWAERCLLSLEEGVHISCRIDEVLAQPVDRHEWETASRHAFRALCAWCEGRVAVLRAGLTMPLTVAPKLERSVPAVADWRLQAHEREAPGLTLESRAAYGARPRTGEQYSRSVQQAWFRPSGSRIACAYCVWRTEDALEHGWRQYSRSFAFAQFPQR